VVNLAYRGSVDWRCGGEGAGSMDSMSSEYRLL
jgi:hypothetical protein